jgi:hypothetical protein
MEMKTYQWLRDLGLHVFPDEIDILDEVIGNGELFHCERGWSDGSQCR